jgi:hypothetical protein
LFEVFDILINFFLAGRKPAQRNVEIHLKLPQALNEYSLKHGAIPETLTVPQAQEVVELMGYKYTKSSHPKVKND